MTKGTCTHMYNDSFPAAKKGMKEEPLSTQVQRQWQCQNAFFMLLFFPKTPPLRL